MSKIQTGSKSIVVNAWSNEARQAAEQVRKSHGAGGMKAAKEKVGHLLVSAHGSNARPLPGGSGHDVAGSKAKTQEALAKGGWQHSREADHFKFGRGQVYTHSSHPGVELHVYQSPTREDQHRVLPYKKTKMSSEQ